MLRGVVSHCVQQRMGHIGLETQGPGSPNRFQQFDHILPAMHPPPQIPPSAARRCPIFGDTARLAECLGDLFLVLGRIGCPIMHPGAESIRTTPDLRMPMSLSCRAMRQAFSTIETNLSRSSCEPIAEPPPTGGQTGATTERTASP